MTILVLTCLSTSILLYYFTTHLSLYYILSVSLLPVKISFLYINLDIYRKIRDDDQEEDEIVSERSGVSEDEGIGLSEDEEYPNML